MSIQDDSRYSDVPDYAKADEVPYYEGPYYEYRTPSQVPVTPWNQAVYGPGMPGPAPIPFPHPPQRRSWSKQTRALIIVCVVVVVLVIAGGGYALFTVGKSLVPSQSTASRTGTTAFAQANCPFTPGDGIV